MQEVRFPLTAPRGRRHSEAEEPHGREWADASRLAGESFPAEQRPPLLDEARAALLTALVAEAHPVRQRSLSPAGLKTPAAVGRFANAPPRADELPGW